jgi:hypothetical protein
MYTYGNRIMIPIKIVLKPGTVALPVIPATWEVEIGTIQN